MKSAIFSLFENWENDFQKAITDQISLVCYAEELGFDEAWISEHHFNNFSVIPSPLSLVSYLLGKTKKIKIGTAGILLPYYEVIKLAEEIASIKSFDEDRFIYGIAKGAFPIYDKSFKINADETRERLYEANELILKLLKEEQVSFLGKFYKCEDISIRPNYKKDIKVHLASTHPQSIKLAYENDFGILGSLAINNDDIREIFRLFNKNGDKKLSFRLARGINIGYNEAEVLEESKLCAEIFLKSMLNSKNQNPTLTKLLTKDYLELRNKLFDKNRILENAIIGSPKEAIKKIKALKKEFDIEALMLKPLTSSSKKAKEVLNLYIKEVKPYV